MAARGQSHRADFRYDVTVAAAGFVRTSRCSVGQRLLDSVIAYRPAAKSTFQFYEKIDTWLGPWDPIGYGKKYNILFATNPPLNRDLIWGRAWVVKTTVLLQEAIKSYIVGRVGAGTIGSITEPQLRAAAFDSHPDAYLRGGLLKVVENSPELFFVILTIPIAEFNPSNPNFTATIRQIIRVIALPTLIELLQAGLGAVARSMPAGIALRCVWEIAAGRIPGIPPLPAGSRDDNFADRLGLFGGLVNIFDR